MKTKVFLITLLLNLSFIAFAQSISIDEKKVDYLERIYFSGENKEGLNTKILISIQEIQQKSPTPSLAKQVTFLLDLQDKASVAEDACDILDLLAVGIYNIDAEEAAKEGVHTPSATAKAKSADAISNLTKLSNTSSSVSSTANSVAWSNYLLTGGKYSSFAAGTGKVASTASTVKQLADLGKSIGINFKKKDKACNDVSKKEIQIGEHVAAALASTIIITIQGINSSTLRVITDTLKNKIGVQSAEKSFNESMSTVTILYSGTTDVLADWLEDKFSTMLKLVDYSTGKIKFTIK